MVQKVLGYHNIFKQARCSWAEKIAAIMNQIRAWRCKFHEKNSDNRNLMFKHQMNSIVAI
jgi:hypothetical protein